VRPWHETGGRPVSLWALGALVLATTAWGAWMRFSVQAEPDQAPRPSTPASSPR
jgi:hypothetical protein